MTYQSKITVDPIDAFRPWEDEATKAARRRLMNARNLASLRAIRAGCETSRQLYWSANEIANRWCLADARAAELTEIANALVRLFLTAGVVDRMESQRGF